MGGVLRVLVAVHILTHTAVVARQRMLHVSQSEAVELAVASWVCAAVPVHMLRERYVCSEISHTMSALHNLA